MATAVQERFREHVNVVDALRANYSSRDDLNRVSAIQQLEAELSELCSRRETNVQAVVKELCRETEAVEAVLNEASPPSAHAGRMKELLSARTSTHSAVEQLNKEKRFLQDQQTSLQQQATEVQLRSERVEELVTETEPRTRHELSLYVHITNISWHLQNNHNRISGKVHRPATKDIRHIDIDPSDKSQFDVVNSIWDTLG
ncbi:hypothetical protein COCSUDRAFT_64220 [Coccomyxa subellipsoidea C-169]|uniref:Kinetochore protein Spc24 n=1 Tax=Coccomyxa subellipsoidea (strain C-169) TaxID=574566 RepID=I0Z9U9_COCSC|nr:hypothetical protein COCSUDRAFT_64220 [Coccomyxa subellipsoidea C-169]EIE27418.1 hypothetical protein COCSUDRAFT_64220 [Coccomyxa subellipsoidea C-169]|eukprot:XP_005651962.1 hypothetical protein COCSUDRAFT_64220 [Coccomyxa subellipsoidea C-169]